MKVLTSPSLWIVLLVVLAVALIPMIANLPALREELFVLLMLIILASSVNIIMGYTGYVSFGHIVFFGIGGYTGFFLVQTLQMHVALAALIGGGVASLIAFLMGMPVLRLRGAYFALATIGINEAFRTLVTNIDQLGGAVGMLLQFSVYDAYGGAKEASQLAYYGIILVALLTITASFMIKKSKFGLALMAIREDQDTAMVLGIDPARAKVMTYAISAFFPALAGALFFFKNGNIEPGPAFELHRSIEALVMVMLGGFGTVTGPIIGAFVYERLRGFLITDPTFSNAHLVISGALLLIIVLFVTAGVIGWLRQQSPVLRRYLE
ncbi:MAG: branched-chain amino acid ABC transporter permease [Chloroflexi bacterium]|nr:branched-chain amino acid ABC transporter permease [Chloroflexota bacterium]